MFRNVLKVFFGVCLLLISGAVFLYNMFLTPNGFEAGLAFLDLLLFLCGLILTIFGAGKLGRSHEDDDE